VGLKVARPTTTRTATRTAAKEVSYATAYEDFVIVAKRRNAREIGVRIDASPAGRMTAEVTVAFPVEEGVELRASFFTGSARGGRAEITIDEAVAIGTRLADVIFPKTVFRLFAESLGKVVGRPNTGLRIRLDMDASLVDLPWEYVRRRDREGAGLMSGFLLLDPSISMVRQRGDTNIAIEAIKGRQSLSFVGTMWETRGDVWQVKKEFGLLCQALKPIADFIEPKFATATKATAFEPERQGAAAIFHYSGHCYFDDDGRPYLAREVPKSESAGIERKFYVEALAPALAAAGTRLAVMSACNSGFWTVVKPLLDAGLPAVIGVNGAVFSDSAIEFCAKLYESLAVGLTLDEAAGRARLHIMEWGRSRDRFDWGLYMVYMPSREPRLFQRATTRAVASRQKSIRQDHLFAAGETQKLARKLDGMDFGEIMSELSRRRVLILGRFSERRLAVLESIKAHLRAHPNKYIPELFTFEKPESTSLTEAIIGFAALSRFIIADLSEPRSVQAELQAIVPNFQSIPVVPLISRTGKEYALFASLQAYKNVVSPTVRYRDLDDLLEKIDLQIVPLAEKRRSRI
jgi:hypothetical protein